MHRELVRLGLGASMLVGLGLSGTQAAAISMLAPHPTLTSSLCITHHLTSD